MQKMYVLYGIFCKKVIAEQARNAAAAATTTTKTTATAMATTTTHPTAAPEINVILAVAFCIGIPLLLLAVFWALHKGGRLNDCLDCFFNRNSPIRRMIGAVSVIIGGPNPPAQRTPVRQSRQQPNSPPTVQMAPVRPYEPEQQPLKQPLKQSDVLPPASPPICRSISSKF